VSDQWVLRLPRVRVLQFTTLVVTLDRFAMPPMILAIADDLDLTVPEVSAAVGGYFLAYGLMQPVWGVVGTRVGAVRLARWSALVAAVATMTTGLSTSAVSLVVMRTLAGAAVSSVYPTALFYAGVTAPPGDRHREVTMLMAGVAVGTSAGTAGGGVIAATIGWQYAFLATGLAGLAMWLGLHTLPELPTARAAGNGTFAPMLEVLRSGPARILLALAAIEGAVLLGTLTFLPAAADRGGSGPALAGVITSIYGVAVLVFAQVVGRLQARVPRPALIGAGALFAIVACLLAAASVRPVAVAVVCVLLGAAWASMHSTLQTWSTEVVPQAGLAAVSAFAAALFAGSSLATVLGGRPAGEERFWLIFVIAAALAVPLGVAGAVMGARWGPETESG
jgi:predicted MFS family arabinose efflux permease